MLDQIDLARGKVYLPGSHLRTTIFPRKIMWEMAQLKVKDGSWVRGQDESDWLNHLDIFDEGLTILQAAGITGGRLVIAPYEVIKQDGSYDWVPMDTAIDMMKSHDMQIDQAIGPFNTPYAPGVRLPKHLQDLLQTEAIERGQAHIEIGGADQSMPASSKAIENFGREWVGRLLEKYGQDDRIEKYYLANEWPDKQGVEGISIRGSTKPITFRVGEDYILSLLDQIEQSGNTKKVVLNTNIRPKEKDRLQSELGRLLTKLADVGQLGFDEYPTQYHDFFSNYEKEISAIRSLFPQTTLLFTELQAAPWPPEKLLGWSWVEIFNHDSKLIKDYFERYFPKTLDTRVRASGIAEVGLWGAEVWIVLKKLDYDFPVRYLAATAHAMHGT